MITDSLIRLPRKIDIIHAPPCSGGDFFANLIALSDPKTLPILMNSDYSHINDKDGNIQRFEPLKYRKIRTSLTAFNHLDRFSAEEIINAYKWNILTGMMAAYTINKGYKIYQNSLIIIVNHFSIKRKKVEILNSQNWFDMIDLSPRSSEGIKHLYSYNKYAKVCYPSLIHETTGRFEFLESFPFLDYVITKDYNTIKGWIENRYGSDLNFDFIDQSLSMWKKVRVDPYL